MTDYCELDDLKTQIEISTTDKDDALEFLITRASRAIDRWCGREDSWFVALTVATAREYKGSGKYWQHIDENVEVSLVEVKDSPNDTDYVEWASTDWIAYTGSRDFPNFNLTPYMALMTDTANGDYSVFTASFKPPLPPMPTVRVTAKWGYAVTVPPQIEEACIVQVSRWFKRAQSSWADTIARGDFGELRYTNKVDSTVAGLLQDGGWVDPRRRM